MNYTTEDIVELLRAIHTSALAPYPFDEEETSVDPNLCFALGQIAGMASKAIATYERTKK